MGNKIFYKGHSIGETTQVSPMPTATADNSGAIVQYVGATNANYTNGYFYKCVSDGGITPTYSWEKVDLGDGTPHWSGTRAEYEAIKDTLEAGTIVNITDDYDDGLEVVDVVEEDNMNPVTSNAVAEAIGNVGTFIHCSLPGYNLNSENATIMSTVNVPKGTWLLVGTIMNTTVANEMKLAVTGDGASLSTGILRCFNSRAIDEDNSNIVIGVAKFTSNTNKVGVTLLWATGTANGDSRYWYVDAIKIAE